MDGWVIISRMVTEHWIWSKPEYGFRWVDLILQVNYSDTKVAVDSKVVVCHRGEVITNYARLAQRWKVSRSTVQRFLELLQREGMIVAEHDTRMTRIRICNYEHYQSGPAKGGTKSGRSRTAHDTNMWHPWDDDEINLTQGCDNAVSKKRTSRDRSDTSLKENNNREQENEGGGGKSASAAASANFYLGAFNTSVVNSRIKAISSIGEGRLQKLLALEESFSRENIVSAFGKAAKSRFLNGEGKKGWVASFDWIIDELNFRKVLEGNYDDEFMEKHASAVSKAQERERRAAEEREREYEERKQRQQEEEDKFKSPENIEYHYIRFGSDAWLQEAVKAGMDIEELKRKRNDHLKRNK